MKTAKIYCIGAADHSGNQDFYMIFGNQEYFLFRQPYRKGVKEYFGNPIDLNRALKNNWNKLDNAVLRTVDKLPQYIRYIEKEYGIAVLERTKKRRA